MGCGCKKRNNVQSEPKPSIVNINGIATPVVTQPAPQVQQQNTIVNNLNTIKNQ